MLMAMAPKKIGRPQFWRVTAGASFVDPLIARLGEPVQIQPLTERWSSRLDFRGRTRGLRLALSC